MAGPNPKDFLERRGLGVVVAVLLALSTVLTASGRERVVGWSQIVVQAFTAEPAQSLFYIGVNNLTPQQGRAARWIARKHRVSVAAVEQIVLAAYASAATHRLDPYLLLAVIAVESSFNPFAQSAVGAQGLMQVMTHIHSDKYENFGGKLAAFDPVTNLRVGVQVLKECIARAGSIEAGLRFYVGAAHLPSDGGYTGKVLAEQFNLKMVASGRTLAFNTPLIPLPPTPAAPTETSPPSTEVELAPKPVVPVPPPAAEQVALNH
jgi:hypothetical protein